MRRIFIWLSGADPEILRNCTYLTNSERIRFASLGALTTIPAILGTFSMAYAISTLAHHPRIYVGAGIVWGFIVLLVDRYLVSTLHKSQVRSWGGMATSMFVRFLFAVLIGVAVAHPLVLLWFKDSITQTIAEDRRAAVDVRLDQAKRDVAAVTPLVSAAEPLEKQRDERVKLKDCLTTLQFYEQSNAQSKELFCGVTSGKASCGARCQQIGHRISQAQQDIAALDVKIAAAKMADDTVGSRREAEIDRINAAAQADVAEINAKFSDDYLARVRALEQLQKRSPQVLVVEVFLILFFVFVDILPLMMKLATPMGEYEHVHDTMLMKTKATEAARQDVINSGKTETALAKIYADGERVLGEVTEISRVPVGLLNAWDAHRTAVEDKVQIVRQRAPAGEEAVVEEQILKFRDMDHQAWDAALKRTMAFVKQQ
jgi:hypothetical protein